MAAFTGSRPKDDSYRSTNVEPFRPSRHPALPRRTFADRPGRCARTAAVRLRRQRTAAVAGTCSPAPTAATTGAATSAARLRRRATDGTRQRTARQSRLVVVDAAGLRASRSHRASSGTRDAARSPSGRGSPRLISAENSGPAKPRVRGQVAPRRKDHRPQEGCRDCPGSGEQPASDVHAGRLAAGQGRADAARPQAQPQEWMAEDGIPRDPAEQRLGHQVPRDGAACTPSAQRMRERADRRPSGPWEESLRERRRIDPHSSVPLLDTLLAPSAPDARENTISQIPPIRRQLIPPGRNES